MLGILGRRGRERLEARIGEAVAAARRTTALSEEVAAAGRQQAAGLDEVGSRIERLNAIVRLQGHKIDRLLDALAAEGARAERLEARLDEVAVLSRRTARTLKTAPGLRAVAAEPGVALVRLATGQRLFVDTCDIGVGAHLLMNGEWEPAHVRLMRRLVRPGQTCLDIGAHCGFFSVVLSGLVGREGRLVAFEPNPRLFGLLARSLRVNGFERSGVAEAFNLALSDAAGEAVLRVPASNPGGGSLTAPPPPMDDGEAWSEHRVRTALLDSLGLEGEGPLFAKIDAEGSEYRILRGAEQTLAREGPVAILMEFTPELIARQLPVPEFARYLASLGFTAHAVPSGGEAFETIPADRLAQDPPGYVLLSTVPPAELAGEEAANAPAGPVRSAPLLLPTPARLQIAPLRLGAGAQ